ncbi:hypothetical protein HDV00_004996 [Rhizophlyctis rosea]|nr:hypothetical protein HDV00_004996 [Rhizophlyctis rosea]
MSNTETPPANKRSRPARIPATRKAQTNPNPQPGTKRKQPTPSNPPKKRLKPNPPAKSRPYDCETRDHYPWEWEGALDVASSHGHISVLKWFKDSGLKLRFSHEAMDGASKGGHVDVLKWWKASGLKLKFTCMAIDGASAHGHVSVLQWWKDSGLKLEYTSTAMKGASSKGHVNVLEWWKQSGLKLKFGRNVLGAAIREGHVAVLDWWKSRSGLTAAQLLPGVNFYSPTAAKNIMAKYQSQVELAKKPGKKWRDEAGDESGDDPGGGSEEGPKEGSEEGSEEGLEEGREDDSDEESADEAGNTTDSGIHTKYGYSIGITGHLPWWDEPPDGIPIKKIIYIGHGQTRKSWGDEEIHAVQQALCSAARKGNLAVLDWWRESKLLTRRYWSDDIVTEASACGNRNGLKLHANDVRESLEAACKNGKVQILEWWTRHGGKNDIHWCKTYGLSVDETSGAGHGHILQYLHTNSIRFSYTDLAIDLASANGHIPVLNWWKHSGLPLKYHDMLLLASINNHISVLDWWAKPGDPKWNRRKINADTDGMRRLIDAVSRRGHVGVLEWWKKKKWKLAWSEKAYGREVPYEMKKWWAESGLVPREAVRFDRGPYDYEDETLEEDSD